MTALLVDNHGNLPSGRRRAWSAGVSVDGTLNTLVGLGATAVSSAGGVVCAGRLKAADLKLSGVKASRRRQGRVYVGDSQADAIVRIARRTVR
jgi:hypothetical protein